MASELAAILGPHLRAQFPDTYVPTSRWYASGSGMCWRQRWYTARRIPRDEGTEPDARSVLTMATGSWLHERLQSAMLAAGGEAVEAEVSWRDELIGLGVRADLLVTAPALGLRPKQVPCIVEIKTVSDFGFRKARNDGPEDRHVMQAMHGAVMHGSAAGVLIVYLSRDKLELASWYMPLDDDWRQRIQHDRHRIGELDRLEKVPHRVIPGVGVVAEPAGRAAPWPCRYCAWRDRCEEDGE